MSIYQLVVKGTFTGSGDALRNVHHYEFPSYVPTAAELAEAIQGIADAYEEILLAAFASHTRFDAFDARRVDIGDQPTQEIIPDGWPLVGTGTGAPLPPQVAALSVWKAPTEFPRSTRTYHFPMVVNAVSPGGFLASVWQAALDTFGLALEEVPVTGQVDAQKCAVQYSGNPRVVTASNLVFQSPSSNVWATQRSRRPGTGI